jgi:microsomal dipeptidase-like Zn-dependent dipeptidase
VLSNGSPDGRHNTDGWPTFAGWPTAGSYTHEQVYYRWLERAWRGGLRIVTNLLVDNNQLCKLYPYKRNSCNEMDNVRLQAQRMHELERYIDAQSGGPGEGWYRIVTDPMQAREVINAGKLAVVMGIEVSRLFDCSANPRAPECTEEIVEERLDEAYDLGVRQMELVNKFDNQFSGVTGDSGAAGPIVNVGNFGETGSWYRLDNCEDFHEEYPHSHGAADKTHMNFHDEHGTGQGEQIFGRDGIFAAVIDTVYDQQGSAPNPAPVYPGGPHCNTVGLSDLGKFLVAEMAERGMMFDPDHMSVRARYEALDFLADAAGKDPAAAELYKNPKFHGLPYSGVVSSHSWADDGVYKKIYELGGVVTPAGDQAADFVEEWEKQRSWFDDRYVTGFGFGSDTNGFSAHGGPSQISYPFTGFGGAVFDKQYSGPAPDGNEAPIGKTYDLNVDGVAHYGLFADWVESARSIAGENGPEFLDDMFTGAEAYLQMWERANGVPPDACRSDVPDLTDHDLAGLSEGMSTTDVLWALGQPSSRTDTTFTYCLDGGRTATLEFSAAGALLTWTGKGGPQPTALELADAIARKGSSAVARATLTSGGSPVAGKSISFYVVDDSHGDKWETLIGTATTVDGVAQLEIPSRYASVTPRVLRAEFTGDSDFLGSEATAWVYRATGR